MNTSEKLHLTISMRKLSALLFTAVLSTVVLSGCGSDDSAATANNAGSSAASQSGDDDKSSRDGLPDGFPDDVPLPEFDSAKKIGGSAEGDDYKWWSIVFVLAKATDTPVEDYAAQLTDAGYTVEQGPGGGKEAIGPQWEISFHSSMGNSLTIAVSSN